MNRNKILAAIDGMMDRAIALEKRGTKLALQYAEQALSDACFYSAALESALSDSDLAPLAVRFG